MSNVWSEVHWPISMCFIVIISILVFLLFYQLKSEKNLQNMICSPKVTLENYAFNDICIMLSIFTKL